MAWGKVGNTSGSGDDFDTGVFTSTKFIQVLFHNDATGGTVNRKLRVGNTTIDSGNNYASRSSQNGGSDGTSTSTDNIIQEGATSDAGETGFSLNYIINITTEEKLVIGFGIDVVATGAGTAPNRREQVSKWANTSSQINVVGGHNNGTGDFTTDTDLSVLGTD